MSSTSDPPPPPPPPPLVDMPSYELSELKLLLAQVEEETPPVPHLPDGFGFVPTDEQLVRSYLIPKVRQRPLPCATIRDVDLYSYDPEELVSEHGSIEGSTQYFFTPRERKYKNGKRPRRSARSGYWKATGADKKIFRKNNNQLEVIGYKKSLVYHRGKQPRGEKTGWMMQEYRILESEKPVDTTSDSNLLDSWVLCKIYKREAANRNTNVDAGSNRGQEQQQDEPHAATAHGRESPEEHQQHEPAPEQEEAIDWENFPPIDFDILQALITFPENSMPYERLHK